MIDGNEHTGEVTMSGGTVYVASEKPVLACIAIDADEGHLDLLQWARAQDCPWKEDICWAAAAGEHTALLQWARARGCPE